MRTSTAALDCDVVAVVLTFITGAGYRWRQGFRLRICPGGLLDLLPNALVKQLGRTGRGRQAAASSGSGTCVRVVLGW